MLVSRKRFIYCGFLQLAELDAANATETVQPVLRKTYLWDPMESTATRILAMTTFDETGTYVENLFYTHDLLKNTTGLFDTQGECRALYEYGPYGNVLRMEGNMAKDNPFRFSSEYADDELGLVYYNYRYYNILNGRWLNREPIGEDGNFNLYRMVYNNLFTFIDYTGSIPVKTPDAAMTNSPSYLADIARATRGITSSSNISRRAARVAAAAAAVVIATRKGCKPCKPPAGSKRHDIAKPGSRERGAHKCDTVGHVKVWTMNQAPFPSCICNWNGPVTLENTQTPPEGSAPDGPPPS